MAVNVNCIVHHDTQIAILSPVEGADESFPSLGPLLGEILTSRFHIDKVHAVFCLLSSGEEMNMGRVDRDRISKGIYETAAKLNGLIITNGENRGLAAELGNAREHYCQIYDDRVPMLGLTANQDMLKLSLNLINEHHHGVVCVKVC